MSNSAINTQVAQQKIGNVQNQADSSAVYSAGAWSFKNASAVTSVQIDNSGNVGVGITPVSVLDVLKVSAATNPVSDNTFPSWTSGLTLRNTSTTDGAYTSLSFLTGNAAGTGQGFSIVGQSTNSGFSSNLLFMARTASGTTTERGRIDNSGIWTLGPVAINNADDGLHSLYGGMNNSRAVGYNNDPNATLCTGGATNDTAVNSGTIYKWGLKVTGNAGGYVLRTNYIARGGSWTLGPYVTSTTWTNISDEKYKENISDIEYGLAEVLSLQPRKFTWKTLNKEDIGFIAQELQPIIPEVVDEQPEGLGVSYGQLVPVLVKAIQELSAKVDAQAAEIAALKAS